CYLKGRKGDRIHALLCGVGMNLRKVMKKLRELLFVCYFFRFSGLFWRYVRSMIFNFLCSLASIRRAEFDSPEKIGV
ncbi:hypothetical protein, partial [Kushneria aurantia]|uniref:hypothetical protein n=1 Tax=Kushneria aurantia TaxID=504092 RepID=UPI0005247608